MKTNHELEAFIKKSKLRNTIRLMNKDVDLIVIINKIDASKVLVK